MPSSQTDSSGLWLPNELDNTDRDIYANMRRPKRIRFISSPTENAQARFASNWLLENDRYKAGRKTAVVMCDESILLPIMHSLPPEADKVNITSGFPLAMTPVASLVMLLFDLYTLGLRKKGTAFNPHYMKKLMAHPYARHLQEMQLKEMNDVHLKGVHLSQVHQPSSTISPSAASSTDSTPSPTSRLASAAYAWSTTRRATSRRAQ